MTVKQISVFLENKTGRINEVTRILGANDINMSAFSIAENADFGIMRIVVCDVDRAVEVLKQANFAVSITDVLCLSCPNTSGALAKILDYLAAEEIFIEYMYAFSQGNTASIVIRPNEIERSIKILQQHKAELIGTNQLYSI